MSMFFNNLSKYFSSTFYFAIILLFIAIFCWRYLDVGFTNIADDVPINNNSSVEIQKSNSKVLITKIPSFCDNWFVKNPEKIFSLKNKEDNRRLGIWYFNIFESSSGELVAVRKVNDSFQGIFTCGKNAYGNLSQRTVREAKLLEKTGTSHYYFQDDFLEEQRFKQIFEEAYKHF